MLTLLHALALAAIGLIFGVSGGGHISHHGTTVHANDSGGGMPLQ